MAQSRFDDGHASSFAALASRVLIKVRQGFFIGTAWFRLLIKLKRATAGRRKNDK
ncbi:hypothetical protein [Pseudomonas chlororaphis]|uniref:hypothetical protein n=1 Tax=Pseudomonas chlororaphis TaxID=587753 RepID=UPI0015DFF3FA|nr:hypothetical protein [Pseudomonas chlororaphis]QLL10731.1 hypothetical protein H0I86_16825 [Pseudomonas chlororaphis subsp. aurantiaca]